MLSGIRVVKAFAQEDREYQRFAKSSDELRNWRLWVENANAWYSATMSIVFSLGGLIVWYVGGRDVIGNSMTLGELIAFLAYLGMFYAPLSALSNFTSWLTSFLTGSKRVLELLDTPLTVSEPTNPVQWDSPKGEIRFEDVSFGYDRNQPVLKNISFHVQPGEMIGIVGRSGSGKSTMVNLLGRFYDVQEGRILVDDIDLRDLPSNQLRERLGIVFQESGATSALENLTQLLNKGSKQPKQRAPMISSADNNSATKHCSANMEPAFLEVKSNAYRSHAPFSTIPKSSSSMRQLAISMRKPKKVSKTPSRFSFEVAQRSLLLTDYRPFAMRIGSWYSTKAD
jgi:ABC-type bacteriocin/lantibiotic exporter with double-glycine peptidase domain